MMRRDDPVVQSFGEKFKNLDVYGKAIQISFRGEDTSKTYYGAIATCVIFFLIAQNTILLLRGVFLQEYDLNRVMQTKNLLLDNRPYMMNADNFNFAIALTSRNEEVNENIERYFRVILLYEQGAYDTEGLS